MWVSADVDTQRTKSLQRRILRERVEAQRFSHRRLCAQRKLESSSHKFKSTSGNSHRLQNSRSLGLSRSSFQFSGKETNLNLTAQAQGAVRASSATHTNRTQSAQSRGTNSISSGRWMAKSGTTASSSNSSSRARSMSASSSDAVNSTETATMMSSLVPPKSSLFCSPVTELKECEYIINQKFRKAGIRVQYSKNKLEKRQKQKREQAQKKKKKQGKIKQLLLMDVPGGRDIMETLGMDPNMPI